MSPEEKSCELQTVTFDEERHRRILTALVPTGLVARYRSLKRQLWP